MISFSDKKRNFFNKFKTAFFFLSLSKNESEGEHKHTHTFQATMLLASSAPHLHPLPSLTSNSNQRNPNPNFLPLKSPRLFGSHRLSCHKSNGPGDAKLTMEAEAVDGGAAGPGGDRMSVGIGNPSLPVRIGIYRMSLGDQAFFLLAFIACTVRFLLLLL